MSGMTVQEAQSWRNYITSNLPKEFKILSPLRGQVPLKEDRTIESSYCNSLFCSQRAITSRDRNDIMQSDVMILNLLGAKRVSIGSIFEAGWADMRRIPIILIMEKSGNVNDHPILREVASWIVPTLDKALKVCRSVFDI
jgi:nucleoside 2-deoxyribosyltransferase